MQINEISFKYGRTSKIVHDLKFGRIGIKRWIVKYLFHRYLVLASVEPDSGPSKDRGQETSMVQIC